MSENRNPDLQWYQAISAEKNVLPRCPFASFKKCPKYFFSYSLADSCGITAALSKKDDSEIMEYWGKTCYLPMPREIEPCISGTEKKNFRNYCPEVISKIFGYFASSIYNYIDEIDLDNAERLLSKERANKDDYRWIYSSVSPMHYLDCEYFSILSKKDPEKDGKTEKREDIVEIKPNIYGIGINLNALARKIKNLLYRERVEKK